jgi:hypothetical protein
VQAGAPVMDGKGGGRPEMAQARGSRRDRVPSALEAIRQAVSASLDVKPSAGNGGPGANGSSETTAS